MLIWVCVYKVANKNNTLPVFHNLLCFLTLCFFFSSGQDYAIARFDAYFELKKVLGI